MTDKDMSANKTPANTPTLEEIVALCKRRGFAHPASEIYGGLANTYNYGPLGAELLRNLKNLWWKEFISDRDDMVGLDTAIILHPQTWVASGHVDSFSDPLIEDTVTHKRYRADHIIEAWTETQTDPDIKAMVVEDLNITEMGEFISKHNIISPDGNPFSPPKQFNLLFESSIGAVAGEKSVVYLRGETAQGIFTDFKQVLDSTRVKLPFGIGNIGKSFRNEITTGQFVFRTLEFEQAEIEYFFDPEQANWQELFDGWKESMWSFVTDTLGISQDNLQWRKHTDKERSHYSRDTFDLDFKFPFGFKELWGISYRTDYDLKQQMKLSGQSLEYFDPHTNRRFVPHVIEPAVGIGRLFLMILCDAYWRDEENNRTVLKLKPSLAPYQVAIFPLLKNKPALVEKARQVHQDLKKKFRTTWDDRGNIGKRYLYQDEMGTPFCVTIDFESLDDEAVTIRHRDTTKQERVKLSQLEETLQSMIG
jgi:glycyl-tRNA synthetase